MTDPMQARDKQDDYEDLLQKYTKMRETAVERAKVSVAREMRNGKYGPRLTSYAASARPRHAA